MSYVGRQDIWNSSLAHEVAHQVQNCSPEGVAPDGADRNDSGLHARWVEDGVYSAIDSANLALWDFYFVTEGHEHDK